MGTERTRKRREETLGLAVLTLPEPQVAEFEVVVNPGCGTLARLEMYTGPASIAAYPRNLVDPTVRLCMNRIGRLAPQLDPLGQLVVVQQESRPKGRRNNKSRVFSATLTRSTSLVAG